VQAAPAFCNWRMTFGLNFNQVCSSTMPVEEQTPAIEDRALEVFTLLAYRGQHRTPSISF
jgi:hypothetical protein